MPYDMESQVLRRIFGKNNQFKPCVRGIFHNFDTCYAKIMREYGDVTLMCQSLLCGFYKFKIQYYTQMKN